MDEGGLHGERPILPSLKAFVIGLAFRIFENLGLEERIVGIGRLIKKLRSLRVEFESILKEFQGIVDLGRSVRDKKKCNQEAVITHLEVLGRVDLLVNVLFWFDIDGREGGLQIRLISGS